MNPFIADKVVLITGATSGLGKTTALHLARLGATVIVHGRNTNKTDAVVAELQASTGNVRIIPVLADLLKLSDVVRMASMIHTRFDHLDILINNAGGGFATYQETEDAFEKTWQLNFLSHFLLTALLMPMLSRSKDARVIGVSSASHKGAHIAFDDPNLRQRYTANRAYGQAKLAIILFNAELARRTAGTLIRTFTVDPGPVATNLFYNADMMDSRLLRFGERIHRLMATSPEKGAETMITLASTDDTTAVSGQYWAKNRGIRPSATADDQGTQHRLWQLSEQALLPFIPSNYSQSNNITTQHDS